ITILSADKTRPCDRPNLSKGYLSGTATDDSNLLRSTDFYTTQKIDLQLGVRVTSIDTAAKTIEVEGGGTQAYDVLLLATGATPRPLEIPGADQPHVHYLRTLSDARALVAGIATAKHAVIIGASFIGLEVASSLRKRGVGVHVVGTETTLMEKVLGPQVGDFLRKLHEQHGVTFHLGTTATSIDEHSVTLANGERVQADLVVIGIGVIPSTALAKQAGLAVDHGVLVDAYLHTSAPDVFAAGDIASWPDRLSGKRVRVEHWVVAERQGQTAAHNILGRQERFDHVPFFWTQQYDFSLRYVGHAAAWDEIDIDGSLEAGDCTVTYRLVGQELAKAFVHRDLESLRTELAMEQRIAASPVEVVEA
ncbi:MAG: NAD(P)/FAD-dependent oxidoreductase, partial [Rhodanobacter sp.]